MTRRAPALLALLAGLTLAGLTLAGCTSSTGSSPSDSATLPSAASSTAPSPAGATGTSTAPTAAPTAAPTSSASVGTSRPASRTAGPSRTSASGTAAPVAGGPCRDGQLRISLGEGNGAGGHDGLPIRFRNVSSTACVLQGYPGYDVLGRNGQVLAHAERTPTGFYGGSRDGILRVVVTAGGVASAIVEWASADAQHPGGNGCDVGTAVAITAANTYDAVRFATRDASICSLQVHPTVPGATGRAPSS